MLSIEVPLPLLRRCQQFNLLVDLRSHRPLLHLHSTHPHIILNHADHRHHLPEEHRHEAHHLSETSICEQGMQSNDLHPPAIRLVVLAADVLFFQRSRERAYPLNRLPIPVGY